MTWPETDDPPHPHANGKRRDPHASIQKLRRKRKECEWKIWDDWWTELGFKDGWGGWWIGAREGEARLFFIERERMSETGEREEKRKRKRKERNIILMRGGNKKYYLILALSYSAQP